MYTRFPEGAAKHTDPAAAAEILYDAVIVGGGIAGAITVSTSNVTLTVAALCLRSIRAMLAQLDSQTAPIDIGSTAATRDRLQEVAR